MLVERCLAHAASSGLSKLVLLTTTAERYFTRFGFEVVSRDEVPAAVRESVEFTSACPASATVMQVALPARTNVVVRPANRDDALRVCEIYNAGIRTRMATFETRERTVTDIEAWFESDRHPILVAEWNDEIVGWIAASQYRPRECYSGIAEFSVYVAPFAQGWRIGDTLMAAFIPVLERAGFWKVLSRIFPENAASLALCRRHAFREVGRYEKHAQLDGQWRDVVIIERLLGRSVAQ